MAARSRTLVFRWREGHHVHLMLPAMIAVAAAFHLGALLFFRLIYPEPQTRVFRPVSVYVLPENPGAFASSGPWMAISDPSLFASTIPDHRLAGESSVVEYEPSFDRGAALLRPLATAETPASNGLKVLGPVDVAIESTESSTMREDTENGDCPVRVSGDFSEIALPPGFPLPASADAGSLRPAGLLAGIDPDGKLVALFLERPSGVAEWDRRIESALRKAVFPASQNSPSIRWAHLSVYAD